ncbi:ABC transporter ATP-binding protein [Metabacillus arenae]|uniref:ABC transporter ATP-binding protein n=1 Tax=Metabacillus arenae TaxID=2771434 RepID=A0A926NHS3_9BACI|nr:ABC transporter ATP-binding protein [Metabacillus arenae]MBD1381030.1 ABC transporter ATP-binding protein [Metabacillus arenae]
MRQLEPLLQAENVHVSVGKKAILKDIHLSFEKGKIYGLLGPNGAGKTTLLKVLLGVFPPTKGSIAFDHHDLYKSSNMSAIHSIGSIIEFPGFYDNLTLYENIELHLKYLKLDYSKEEIVKVLLDVGLHEHKDKLFSQTSLGMKQRLGIGRAIAHHPKLLLLDEPTNGLDPQGIKEVREMLLRIVKDREVTVIVSSHLLSEINLMADELIIMNNGEVVFESKSLKRTQEIFLYKFPVKHLDRALIDKISEHVLTSGKAYNEFISALNPEKLSKELKNYSVSYNEMEVKVLSLEDLYLKLIAKVKTNEFISA